MALFNFNILGFCNKAFSHPADSPQVISHLLVSTRQLGNFLERLDHHWR